MIKTPYCNVTPVRKDCLAITIVKVRRRKKYHGIWYEAQEFAHIEHKKIPKFKSLVRSNCGGWADPVATYDLDGNEIALKDQ